MLMIGVLCYFISGCEVPHNGLTIPRAAHEMLGIDEIYWWNGAIVFEQDYRMAGTIEPVDFTIRASY